MVRLHFVTLVTRPQNLGAIAESIARAMHVADHAAAEESGNGAGADVEMIWHQVIDGSKVRGFPSGFNVVPAAGWAGEPYLRNYALDELVHDGHIAWLDDDNLVESGFVAAVVQQLRVQPDAALVFDQLRADRTPRLTARPENMRYGAVDTAQVVAPRELYGDLRFANRAEGCDGVMYEQLFKAQPERFRFVNEPRVLYNALG